MIEVRPRLRLGFVGLVCARRLGRQLVLKPIQERLVCRGLFAVGLLPSQCVLAPLIQGFKNLPLACALNQRQTLLPVGGLGIGDSRFAMILPVACDGVLGAACVQFGSRGLFATPHPAQIQASNTRVIELQTGLVQPVGGNRQLHFFLALQPSP